jgi:hypothetical protein
VTALDRTAQGLAGTLMFSTTALWLAATGIVAVSLESFRVAVVLFGIAVLLIARGRDYSSEDRRCRLALKWVPSGA